MPASFFVRCLFPALSCCLLSVQGFGLCDTKLLTANLNRNTGPGFVQIPTAHLLDVRRIQELYSALPSPSTFIVAGTTRHFSPGYAMTNGRSIAIPEEKWWWVREYLDRLTQTLNASLPGDEQVSLHWAEIRASNGDIESAFPEWHTDGEYLAAAVSLIGPGTEYWSQSPRVSGPEFQKQLEAGEYKDVSFNRTRERDTLIFSCVSRWSRWKQVPATVHRSPHFNAKRLFLVARFRARAQR